MTALEAPSRLNPAASPSSWRGTVWSAGDGKASCWRPVPCTNTQAWIRSGLGYTQPSYRFYPHAPRTKWLQNGLEASQRNDTEDLPLSDYVLLRRHFTSYSLHSKAVTVRKCMPIVKRTGLHLVSKDAGLGKLTHPGPVSTRDSFVVCLQSINLSAIISLQFQD